MSSSELVQSHHLRRKAVIYIRQSTGHQVLSNVESRKLQHAMRDQAGRLGWAEEKIDVVETDTGVSAQTTAGRDGYKHLLSDVALGEVGVVLSYESTRLSRNCSDWYPLLDLCTLKGCLIADRDGVYDPASVNGRLLLGMKGILSEVELHTLRGRLTAGLWNKARRGELAVRLPAGLVREEHGGVVKDPNLQVQEAIALVFRTFLEVKSACKVTRHFSEHGLRLPRRERHADSAWRKATVGGVLSILKNPAFAGAYAYGKTEPKVAAGGAKVATRRRRAMEEWSVLLHDRHPAYISWETFQRIQSILHDNYAEYEQAQAPGVPRNGEAVLQGLAWCGECGHKMTVAYKNGTRYLCMYEHNMTGAPICQTVPADPTDGHVVEAFFQAIAPAEIDIYEAAQQARRDAHASVDAAHARELQRLHYEADLARRRYEKIDPDNRLVASELERRWEVALGALAEAEAQFEALRQERDKVVPLGVPRDLRDAFTSFGQSLPELWGKDTLTCAQRKALLRCLVDKVVLLRRPEAWEQAHVRIVWRGGAVSEMDVPLRTRSVRRMSFYAKMEAEILTLAAQRVHDEDIARLLTERGFRSPSGDVVLRATVQRIRLRHGKVHRYNDLRPRRVEGFLTVPQIAEAIGVDAHWVHNRIQKGVVEIQKDKAAGRYLFPDQPETLADFRRLQNGDLKKLRY